MKSLRATARASSLAFLIVLGAYLYTVIAWQRAPAPAASATPDQRSITLSRITGDWLIYLPAKRPVLAVASVIAASVYVIAWQLPHWIHSPLPMLRAAL